jgi:toxin CcdB
MAQFDYYESARSGTYLLNVQSDLIDHLNTVVVIPLMQSDSVPAPLRYLHPVFEVDGTAFTLATHLLTAIPAADLRRRRGSLNAHRDDIIRALDMLLSGV